eukprot:3895367-Prymnesium_polylepis.1
MLAGSNDAQRAAWGIESAEACHYLSQSGVVAVQEHDDKGARRLPPLGCPPPAPARPPQHALHTCVAHP